jgi:hypothetical protein
VARMGSVFGKSLPLLEVSTDDGVTVRVYLPIGLSTVHLKKQKSCDPCQIQALHLVACREHCTTGKLAKGPCLPHLNGPGPEGRLRRHWHG